MELGTVYLSETLSCTAVVDVKSVLASQSYPTQPQLRRCTSECPSGTSALPAREWRRRWDERLQVQHVLLQADNNVGMIALLCLMLCILLAAALGDCRYF